MSYWEVGYGEKLIKSLILDVFDFEKMIFWYWNGEKWYLELDDGVMFLKEGFRMRLRVVGKN